MPLENLIYHTENEGSAKTFRDIDMISFGTFIRENYYQYGSPCLLSYHPVKYPHGKIEDIFVIWCCENGR